MGLEGSKPEREQKKKGEAWGGTRKALIRKIVVSEAGKSFATWAEGIHQSAGLGRSEPGRLAK